MESCCSQVCPEQVLAVPASCLLSQGVSDLVGREKGRVVTAAKCQAWSWISRLLTKAQQSLASFLPADRIHWVLVMGSVGRMGKQR